MIAHKNVVKTPFIHIDRRVTQRNKQQSTHIFIINGCDQTVNLLLYLTASILSWTLFVENCCEWSEKRVYLYD